MDLLSMSHRASEQVFDFVVDTCGRAFSPSAFATSRHCFSLEGSAGNVDG